MITKSIFLSKKMELLLRDTEILINGKIGIHQHIQLPWIIGKYHLKTMYIPEDIWERIRMEMMCILMQEHLRYMNLCW